MFARALRLGLSSMLVGVALPLAALAQDGDLSIVRVYAGWRDAASFKRISEYFTRRENTGGEAVLRTQPGERSGYYFLVRTANADASRAVTARLQLITDASASPTVHTFPVQLKAGSTVFHLGLTGADWTDRGADPVAWKLDLTGADGRVLATEKSYLWDRPPTK